ncbi:sensor histidine kinase [Anaerolineales bacterium HSG6]|nr:sensor histidine kinase [Anaerolineales bacterium HSG6]MDM8532551.1 sensor histidine kinase [Anaerolineales bacterium HSG25]
MLQGGVVLLVSFLYIGLLFAIAYYGDKRADAGRSLISNPYIYALSLGVYCTAWTFYGSVGRAARTGIDFLPIYLGPTLMAALWWFVLRKMIRISKLNRITSIADFIASRYGKSSALAGLVTVIAVVGITPYISLQLKAISNSFEVIWHQSKIIGTAAPTIASDTAFYIALLLAAFAILFGTRHLDATEHHEGLVVAIAFESVVKLLTFLAVGIFVTYGLYDGVTDLSSRAFADPELTALFTARDAYTDWAWFTFLSMMAILFLPRQFHIAVVENVNEQHLNKAIWLFPLYLLAINLFVIPIALGGLLHFPNEAVDPDTFVLLLPMAEGQELLALLVFLGGLSAATSMVIVATIALTTMISNDLIMPVLLRWQWLELAKRDDLGGLILTIRRLSIIIILMLSYYYFRLIGNTQPLVSIGLVSFAAVAQFAPAILGGIYWKGGSRLGALVGLSLGFMVWGYTLPLPALAEANLLPASFITAGPFGITLLKPYQLFGLQGVNPISHAMLWSMMVNLGGYVIVSLLSQPRVLEHRQATLFVDVFELDSENGTAKFWRGSATIDSLRSLLSRFLDPKRVSDMFTDYAKARGFDWTKDIIADADLVDFVEKQLAGVIGAASARVMVSSVVKEESLSMEEVMDILDETSQVIAHSRELEQKSETLEAASVELRTANEQLKELDSMKDDFISTVTHELRTPLTSIRAFSEILSDNPDLEIEQRSQFSAIILKESERLTRLINQVLDLSKIESGQMEWIMSEVDLRAIISETVISTDRLFQDQNIELILDLPGQVPPVMADRDRIIQVLLNLISNAIKFCATENGQVEIWLQNYGDILQVDVIDNGTGIHPDDQEVIFEKFRQVGDTLTEKPQGTGLGLPICRHIIDHFNGKLWVESNPGSGSTFSFTLPIKNEV